MRRNCDERTWPGDVRFGNRGFRPPFGGHMHAPFGGPPWAGPRARRGDVRSAVLRLLAEQPMHGYQIIQELSERSGGSWRPSPGSVYPTLQLLEDEGLVTGEESAGKRVYRLTDAGKTKVAETQSGPAPWDDIAEGETRGDLRGAIGRFMAATWQVMQSGDKDQVARATEILNEARKKMYAILSED